MKTFHHSVSLKAVCLTLIVVFTAGQSASFSRETERGAQIVTLGLTAGMIQGSPEAISAIENSVLANRQTLDQIDQTANTEDGNSKKIQRKKTKWMNRLQRLQPRITTKLAALSGDSDLNKIGEQVNVLIPGIAAGIAEKGGLFLYLLSQTKKIKELQSKANETSAKKSKSDRSIASLSIDAGGCVVLGLLCMAIAVVAAALLGPVLGMIIGIPVGILGFGLVVFSVACDQ